MQGLTKILVLLFAISIIQAFGQVNEKIEVGIDESGAGPMMGNLYIAGVILPNECPYEECQDYWDMLNDSKKLSSKKREY